MQHFTTADYFHYCCYFVAFGALLYSNLLLTKIFVEYLLGYRH